MANVVDKAPDPSEAKDDPFGFGMSALMFMVMAGVAIGMAKLGNRVIANRIVGLYETLSNAVANTAEETSTSDPTEVF
jgi:predicted transporter